MMDRKLFGAGSSDPYVRLACEGEMHKSTTKQKDLEPTWEEVFTFAAFDERASLSLEMYDHDDIGADSAVSFDSTRRWRRCDAMWPRARRRGRQSVDLADWRRPGGPASRRGHAVAASMASMSAADASPVASTCGGYASRREASRRARARAQARTISWAASSNTRIFKR